jgi:PAS domain S-box-containing protein
MDAEARYQAVVVGASLGGVEALQTVLGGLRGELPVPVLVAQHLFPGVSRLDERLARASGLPVGWASDGQAVEPGRVHLCPGRSFVRLEPDGTLTVAPSQEASSSGQVDELFASAAIALAGRVLAVVLTGMGRDGVAGARAVKEAGGDVIVQNEETAAAFGMPSAVINAGHADLVASLGEIPEILDQVIGRGRPLPTAAARGIEAIFSAGGDMGRLMGAMDWNATVLGPVQDWPATLRAVLPAVLTHPMPMTLMWGPAAIQFYNDAYRDIIGDHHPSALGRSALQGWQEGALDIESVLGEVSRTGAAVLAGDRPFVLSTASGRQERYFTFSYSPVYDDGRVAGVLGTAADTTAQVHASRRLAILHRLAATAVDDSAAEPDIRTCEQVVKILADSPRDVPFALIYLAGADGSAHLAAATGLPAGDPALAPLIITPMAPSAWSLRATLDRGEAQVLDDLATRAPGLDAGPWPQPPRTAMVLPIGAAGQGRAPVAVLVAGVSRQIPLGSAYRQFFDLLADQVRTLLAAAHARRDAQDKLAALTELSRAKDEFFANVSHEFRDPLTLMLLPLEELTGLPGPHGEPARTAYRNALRLLRLVNSLLAYAELEQGRAIPVIEEIADLAALTSDLASVFRPALDRAGIELRLDCPPLDRPVQLDPAMWETVVLNLVSNAFKHTFAGAITVALRQRPGHVELSVTDTGTGIPDADIPHLFTRFHRIEGVRARSHEGAGIGLALVRQLVGLHHGSVRVRSTPGTGSSFTAWVPYSQPRQPQSPLHAPALDAASRASLSRQAYADEARLWLDGDAVPASVLDEPPPLPAPPGERPAVLVVDDNPDMRRYLRRLLSDRYHIRAAGTRQALDTLASPPPDLILADVSTHPGGLRLLHCIRASPALQATPVILLTARGDATSALRAIDVGAQDYIVKPFSARELIARIGAQLELARLRRHSGDRYRALIGASWDVTYRVSPDWTEMRSLEGQGFMADTRRPSAGWLDQYIHPDDQAKVTAAIRHAIETKSVFEFEHRVRRPDGTLGWALSRAVPLLGDEGEITEWVGAATDITERKGHEEALRDLTSELERRVSEHTTALRDREERYRALVEASGHIVWTTDAEGRVVEDSPSWREFTGQSPQQRLDRGWLDLVHPGDREHVGRQWREAATHGRQMETQFRLWHAASSEWHLTQVRARPLRDDDGSVRGWVAMNIDLNALSQPEP